jgi:hypothetical protein
MPKRWQYQIQAQVPPTKGPNSWETVQLDKWFFDHSPVRRVITGLSAAILAGSLFLVPPTQGSTSWKEQSDKFGWKSYHVDYHYKKPSLPAAIHTTYLSHVPAADGASSWKDQSFSFGWKTFYIDYHYQRPKQPASIPPTFFAEVPPASGASSWKDQSFQFNWRPVQPDYIYRRPPIPQSDIAFVYAPPVTVVYYLDKWKPVYEDFYVKKPSLLVAIQTTHYVEVPPTSGGNSWAEQSFKFNWRPIYPDFFPRKLIIPQSEAPFIPYIIYPDSWRPSYPDFFPRRPIYPPSELAFVARELVYVDKWLPRYPDRFVPSTRFQPPLIWTPYVAKKIITVDMWLPTYPDRIIRPRLPLLAESPQFVIVPAPWYPKIFVPDARMNRRSDFQFDEIFQPLILPAGLGEADLGLGPLGGNYIQYVGARLSARPSDFEFSQEPIQAKFTNRPAPFVIERKKT